MEWKHDKFREIKHEILRMLIYELSEDVRSKITMKMACDAIDKLFDDIIKEKNDISQ